MNNQVEKMEAKSNAIEQDPSLQTAEGIARREILLTLGALARGETPKTVLWGVVGRPRFGSIAIGEGNGRRKGEISAVSHIDPVNYDGVFSTDEVLDALISEGYIDIDAPPKDTPAGLIAQEDDPKYFGATYILNEPIV
jgi:hypothetical protein